MSESLPLPAAVVVASNRAAAGVYADETGPLIVDALRGWGFESLGMIAPPDKFSSISSLPLITISSSRQSWLCT